MSRGHSQGENAVRQSTSQFRQGKVTWIDSPPAIIIEYHKIKYICTHQSLSSEADDDDNEFPTSESDIEMYTRSSRYNRESSLATLPQRGVPGKMARSCCDQEIGIVLNRTRPTQGYLLYKNIQLWHQAEKGEWVEASLH